MLLYKQLAHEVNLKNNDYDSSKRSKAEKSRNPALDQKVFENLLFQAIIISPNTFSFCCSPSTSKLLQYAAPQLALPSRGKILKNLLPAEIENVRSKVTSSLQQSSDVLTISFDIFTTVFNQTFCVIYATTSSGITYCISCRDFPNQPLPAAVLASLVTASIDSIGAIKIAAFICPSNGLYGEIGSILTSRYPHILVLDPFDHYFEQLAADLCRHQLVNNVIHTMRTIYCYFHRSSLAERLLTTRMNHLHITEGLRPFLPHEPISLYAAAISIRRCMPALVEVIGNDQAKLDRSGKYYSYHLILLLQTFMLTLANSK